jgi:hypothetical protein
MYMHVLDTHWLHAGYDEGAHRATAAQSNTGLTASIYSLYIIRKTELGLAGHPLIYHKDINA